MKLPSGSQAIIDDEKITNYLLNPLHRHGRHHAELFHRLLGVDRDSWQRLHSELRRAAANEGALPGRASEFGVKYEIRFSMTGPRRSHTILSVWMIRTGESAPRFVTAYVEKA
jgi:hypothetical protein